MYSLISSPPLETAGGWISIIGFLSIIIIVSSSFAEHPFPGTFSIKSKQATAIIQLHLVLEMLYPPENWNGDRELEKEFDS